MEANKPGMTVLVDALPFVTDTHGLILSAATPCWWHRFPWLQRGLAGGPTHGRFSLFSLRHVRPVSSPARHARAPGQCGSWSSQFQVQFSWTCKLAQRASTSTSTRGHPHPPYPRPSNSSPQTRFSTSSISTTTPVATTEAACVKAEIPRKRIDDESHDCIPLLTPESRTHCSLPARA